MIAKGEYAIRAEVFANYQSFDLETAIYKGFPLTPKIEDDLSVIEFDTENIMLKFGAPGFQGINTIDDFTFAAVMAGGDWEHPIVFILYIASGELRGFIPDEGNVYNRKTQKAFGNGKDEDDILEDLIGASWDVAALRHGISKAFSLAIINH